MNFLLSLPKPDPNLMLLKHENAALVKQLTEVQRKLGLKQTECQLLEDGAAMQQQSLRAAVERIPALQMQFQLELAQVKKAHDATLTTLRDETFRLLAEKRNTESTCDGLPAVSACREKEDVIDGGFAAELQAENSNLSETVV